MELLYAVACGGHHAFDLVVFALGDGEQQYSGRFEHRIGGGYGFVVIVKQNAVFQGGAQGFVCVVFECHAV